MYLALHRLAIALVALWIAATEQTVEKSIYYVYGDDVSDDIVPDPRVSRGKHIEVTVRVVHDDADFAAALTRHEAREAIPA